MESSGQTVGTQAPTQPGSARCLSERSTRYHDNTASLHATDDWRTKKAAEGQLPAAQSVHQPHP